ncbi:MAG TPA: hypothetical protein VMU80_17480 [Bryobacteraceae bacterium]|nr:hypothetical protein [Bryobacteraceae bacterium]
MRTHLPENVGLKAADVSTLDEARAALAAGATRLGSTAASEILAAWKAELAGTPSPAQ